MSVDVLVTIRCEVKGCDHRREFRLPGDITERTLEVIRRELNTREGWTSDGINDYCPDHR